MREARAPYRVRTVILGLGFAALSGLVAQDPGLAQRPGLAPQQTLRLGSGRGLVGIDYRTRLSIDRALDYLHRNQNPEGSWTDRVGRKVHNSYKGRVAPHVGVTALAGMAFLAGGTLPGQGLRERYCNAVRMALDYIMAHTEPTGFIADNNSRMYSHAFATLFLAEAYGTTLHPDSRKLHDCLRRSVRMIVQSQNKLGGWRYRPGAADADMSITVCQVMALRAARNAGVRIPKETIDAAVDYVKESFVPISAGVGAFKYQIEPRFAGFHHRYSFALTACGVTTLYGAGQYNTPEVRKGLRYLWSAKPERALARSTFDYFYGQYYAVQAAFQAGGAYWIRWYEWIKGDLLDLQEADGSWRDLVGPNYATAMAAIILQMPNQYLPITEN